MAATEIFANNTSATVLSGGTTAPASGTTETWTLLAGWVLPAVSNSSSPPTQCHVADTLASTEKILVTNISGNTATVVRGSEGTVPVAHLPGFIITQVVTAGVLTNPPPLSQYAPIGLTGAQAPTSYAGGTVSGHPLTGTWTQGTWVVDQTGQIWVCVTGGTPGTWRRVGRDPWQFFLDDYCIGDGRVAADAATTASSNVIVSPTIAADPAAVGKHIMVNGGNGTGVPVIGTISGVNTGNNQVTLSLAAGATASGCAAFWSSDDTANINACITAAGNYALANNYFAEIIGGQKFYGVSAGPVQTTSPAAFNSQIPLPYPALNGSSQKLVIKLRGPGISDHADYWESTIPNLAGCCVVSYQTAPSTVDPTYGYQSVIGGPSGGGAFTGGYANVLVEVEGISVVCPAFTNMFAFDFGYVSGIRVDKTSSKIFAPAVLGTNPMTGFPPSGAFQATHGTGMRTPVIGNNDDVVIPSYACEGFETHLRTGDHATIGRLLTVYYDLAVEVLTADGLSGVSHAVTIENWSCEAGNGTLKSAGSSGAYCAIFARMDSENSTISYDISDTGNTLYGRIEWTDLNRTAPTISGAANLKIVNNRLGPGYWSGAPAAPSSGSSQQNTAWRDANVTVVSTAAITAAAVDGNTVFSGSIPSGQPLPLPVPAGHSYSVTSAGGTLTTKWVLS